MKKITIVNHKRFNCFLAFLLITLVLLSLLISSAIHSRHSYGAAVSAEPESQLVRVQSGDTVWKIASPIAKEEGLDPRQVASDIVRLNGLVDYAIYPGQWLEIPQY